MKRIVLVNGNVPFVNTSLALVKIKRKKSNDIDGLYKLIGAAGDEDMDTITKKAKHKLYEVHPDRGGDTEEFKQAYKAYETLTNPVKRQEYDNKKESKITLTIRKSMLYYNSNPEKETTTQGIPYFKPLDMILTEVDYDNLKKWHACVFKQAQEWKMSIDVKVGIIDVARNLGTNDEIAMLIRGSVPSLKLARSYLLRRLCNNV